MGEKSNPLGGLSAIIVELLRTGTDDLKRNVITGLSAGFSRVLAILIISMLMVVVLLIFAFASVLLLGEAIGSLSIAAIIVGAVYLLIAAVLFFLRKRLFMNMFTDLFIGIIKSNAPAYNWKSLLLIFVRNLRQNIEG